MKITYNGHACFSLTSGGYTILLDPYSPGYVPGYRGLNETANQVLCSHEHGDHNAREIIHPAEEDMPCPFEISTMASWHDNAGGRLRGANTIHVLKAEGMTVVHLGDLGTALTEPQIDILRHCSVLLIPIGGHYTIDAQEATRIIRQVEPDLAIPMHYSGPGFGYDVIAPLSPFFSLNPEARTLADSGITLPAPDLHGILALHAKYRIS
ncbi:MAG: MBL fold metallo-hydrolase [Clostridia bacterium]|nr:MBL fold metallo-hydrolase [Clostridia bacterium]